MVSKGIEKAASSVDTQGDASADVDENLSAAIWSAPVLPSPAVLIRSQAPVASDSSSKLVGSLTKLDASHKTASAGTPACVPDRASQVAVSASRSGAVPSRPRADSPIYMDEGEPPRSGTNRRLEDAAMKVEVTPSRVPSPPMTRDPWSGVLQDQRSRWWRGEAVATPAARVPSEEP